MQNRKRPKGGPDSKQRGHHTKMAIKKGCTDQMEIVRCVELWMGVTDVPVMAVNKLVPTGTYEIKIKCNQLECHAFQRWG